MDFYKATARLSQNIEVNGGQEAYQREVIGTLKSLHEKYAPTVEMTCDQKENLLMMKDNNEHFIEIMSEIDGGVLINDFDRYWKPLTENQLMQAYLHPETIKVVNQ